MNQSDRVIAGGVDLNHLVQKQQGSGGNTPGTAGNSGGQEVAIPAVVFDVTEQTFDSTVQLSTVVPVVVVLTDKQDTACAETVEALANGVRGAAGKLAMGVIDAAASPQLAQSFQAQQLPAAIMLLAGQPQRLFEGAQDAAPLQKLLDQIVQLAASQGMTGRVSAPDLGSAEGDKAPEVNPAHAAALAAAEAGDYKTAITEYTEVLRKHPQDTEAQAALAQIKLLDRLSSVTAENIQETRKRAADNPTDVAAQLLVADLDVSGGHVEDAFLRLLELFAACDETERQQVQEHLLELFTVVGVNDPRVNKARRNLANLLY